MAKEAPTIAITPAERQAREKLALCARSLHKIGVYDLAGHISMRIPDSDGILITPGGGLDKARLTGADMTTIDADGNHVGGPYPPPLETPIHTVVHAARSEPVWCVRRITITAAAALARRCFKVWPLTECRTANNS